MAHNAEPVHGTDITAAQEMMTAVDVGARRPGRLPAAILTAVALAWAIMQLWYASPLPFIFHVLILNDTQA
ncbi:MAG TPA: hypothetical protein VE631_07520, partial [Alphaproteobacteria bacterium]|nr:hypothetical protein [Alphaproteobacteria bacterium]